MSMLRDISQRLPPPAECFAIFVGALELVPFGIAALRNPTYFAESYGLPISNDPDEPSTSSKSNPSSLSPKAEHQTKRALIAAIAARNLQNGLIIMLFGLFLRDRRSLGIVITAGLVTTLTDTIIVKMHGLRDKVVGHCIGIFNSLVIGGSLLYWTRSTT